MLSADKMVLAGIEGNVTASSKELGFKVTGGMKNNYGSSFGEVMIFTDGDKKAVFVQGEETLKVYFIATDENTMKYTVQAIDYNIGEI